MTKISSGMTSFYKKGFPLLWFGILAVSAAVQLHSKAPGENLFSLLILGVMAVFGYVLMTKFVWDLADEVLDGGDFLRVRRRGHEERVPLSNIMNVSAMLASQPQRITLRLIAPGRFGPEIAFAPRVHFSLNLTANHPIAEDLMLRVHKARSRHAA